MALVLLAPVGLESGTALVGPEEVGTPAEADTLAPSEAVGIPGNPETRLPDPDQELPAEACNDAAFNPAGYARVVLTEPGSRFTVTADGGRLNRVESDRWSWTAPDEPGATRITVCRAGDRETIRLNAFVMVPYEGEPELNGYRIGSYRQLLPFDPAYRTPLGMVEVTPDIEDIWLSTTTASSGISPGSAGTPTGMPRTSWWTRIGTDGWTT
jgi:hypothetical protein